MAMTFPSDTQRGTPAWLTKLTATLIRARYRALVGDSNAAGKVPLTIQGAPSQTANLLEFYDGSKNGLAAFDNGGAGQSVYVVEPVSTAGGSVVTKEVGIDITCASGVFAAGTGTAKVTVWRSEEHTS